MCHLNTELLFGSRSSEAPGGKGASEDAESSSRANEAGREGKGSGELAGDRGSKSKDEHSGSGREDSVFGGWESGGSVEDSADVVGEFWEGNTVFGINDEVAHVEGVDVGVLKGDVVNTDETSGISSSEDEFS